MKNNINIFWRVLLFVCLITVSASLLYITLCRDSSVLPSVSDYTQADFGNGWERLPEGNTIKNDKKGYIYIPNDMDTHCSSIQKYFEDDYPAGTKLSFRTRCGEALVEVNGEEIYSYSSYDTFKSPPFYTTHIVSLPEISLGDRITVTLNDSSAKGYYIQNLSVGSYSDILIYTFRTNIGIFVVCLVLFVMSAVLLIVYLSSLMVGFTRDNASTLWLMFFTFFSSVWIFSDYGLLDFAVRVRPACYFLNSVSFMLLPVCFMQFVKCTSFKKEKFLDLLSGLDCLFIISNVLLYTFGLKSMVFDIFVYHIISILGIMWTIIKYITGNIKVQLEVIIGIGALFCFSIMNIVVFWSDKVFPVAVLFSLGVLIFAICMFVLTMHNLVELQQAKLREENYKSEKDLAVNKMLLTQISSHFFYNTMNTIRALIKTDTDAAYKMVGDFGKYMRFYIDSVNVDGGIIKFSNELVAVKALVDISAVQMGERLKMEYDIQCPDFDMPQLTVQPLVENAIKHGIGAKPEGGTVKLTVRESADNYTVEVSDNGKGFYTGKDAQKNSVAIKNIRQRLAHFRSCAMIIKSVPNEGSCITLLFPKKLVSRGDHD